MEFYLGLEGMDLGDPGNGILGLRRIQMIPSGRRIRRRQSPEEHDDPLGRLAKAGTHPISLRVGGAARQRLDQPRLREATGERPEELQSGPALGIKEFQDHRASGPECGETRERLGNQEPLHRVFLAIEVRTEIKSAVSRVDIGLANVFGCVDLKGILVGDTVEIPRVIGPIGDADIGIGLQEGLGFAPAGNGSFRGFERHGDHGNLATDPILNGLQESTGAFGGMGCGIGSETQEIPEFHHFEVTPTQRLDGSNRTVHAPLEREKDIFIGICDFLGVVPVSDGSDAINLVFERNQAIVDGGVKRDRG